VDGETAVEERVADMECIWREAIADLVRE
jgi:hypothetical protein